MNIELVIKVLGWWGLITICSLFLIVLFGLATDLYYIVRSHLRRFK